MARLVNYKGRFSIEIEKENKEEIYLLTINNEFFLDCSKKDDIFYSFTIFDHCQGDIYSANESDYRTLLSKITDNPKAEIITPKDVRIEGRLEGFAKIFTDNLNRFYPNNHEFLKEVGTMKDIPGTAFKWDEKR